MGHSMSQQMELARQLARKGRRRTKNGSQIAAQQGHRQYTRSRSPLIISIVCWQPNVEHVVIIWSSSKCNHKVELAMRAMAALQRSIFSNSIIRQRLLHASWF